MELQRVDDLPGDKDALASFEYWLVPVFIAGCICMPLSFKTWVQAMDEWRRSQARGLSRRTANEARLAAEQAAQERADAERKRQQAASSAAMLFGGRGSSGGGRPGAVDDGRRDEIVFAAPVEVDAVAAGGGTAGLKEALLTTVQ